MFCISLFPHVASSDVDVETNIFNEELEELGCGWKKILADFEDTNSLNNDQAFEKVEMLYWKLLKDEYLSSLANLKQYYVDGYGWNNFLAKFSNIYLLNIDQVFKKVEALF